MRSTEIAVKICGLRSPEQIDWVRASGASLAGLVFAESRRRVTVADAQTIVAAARSTNVALADVPRAAEGPTPLPGAEKTLQVVGVFARQSADDVARVATACQLDFVQLSGHEAPAVTADLAGRGLRVIVVVHVAETMSRHDILADVNSHVAAGAEMILLDTASAQGGGSGLTFDWRIACQVIASTATPVLLAGGLTPGNVAEAVRMAQPWGVDVSSGVETDGVKDRALIGAFVQAARKRALVAERGAG
jgi:phosphoribosylanthranilate isomerase